MKVNNILKTREKNSKPTKKRFERAKKIADEVKKALMSGMNSIDIVTVGPKMQTNMRRSCKLIH